MDDRTETTGIAAAAPVFRQPVFRQPVFRQPVFRQPGREDGPTLWRLARASGGLEVNSAYSYIMMAHFFGPTCVLAEDAGRPIGFVSGFIPPERPDTVFVWQIGVDPGERGRGLGRAMLSALVSRPACATVRYLDATVTPSNRASRSLFSGFARAMGTAMAESEGFPASLFPEGAHEAEHLLRIGPFRPGAAP